MTLVRLSGARSLRNPLISRLLCECAPLAENRWVEATKVGYHSLVCAKQVEGVKPVTARDNPPPPLWDTDACARPPPPPLVAIVGPCTCGPITFNRVHQDCTPWVGGGPSPLLYVGMHIHVRVGVGPHYPVGSATMANGGAHPPICGYWGWPCAGIKIHPPWQRGGGGGGKKFLETAYSFSCAANPRRVGGGVRNFFSYTYDQILPNKAVSKQK